MTLIPRNIVLFALLVALTVLGVPLWAMTIGLTPFDWWLCAILYTLTGLSITIGYHRLFSHRSFQCAPWLQRVLLITGGWAMQNSALIWCADHLRHHARTDTHEDPYNARRGWWHSHCGWLFYTSPYREAKYAAPFSKDALIQWQHAYYWPIVASGFALPFLLGWWWHASLVGALGSLLTGGVARVFLVLNSTFTINSLCHMIGTQPHGTHNSSHDSWWISLISFGEGYHNYHHAYPRDYRNGTRWYNFDPSKWMIYALSHLGITSSLRRLS